MRSPSFKVRSEYVPRFFPRNYLHLTGALTALSSMNFYSKALDGSLSRSDFDCDSTPALKDTIRCKVRNLQNIGTFFERVTKVEEDFSSGSVRCKFATSEGTYTLGFTGASFLAPNTLLNNDKIRETKQIVDFEMIIQRKQLDDTSYIQEDYICIKNILVCHVANTFLMPFQERFLPLISRRNI